jgi:hypothetical protein
MDSRIVQLPSVQLIGAQKAGTSAIAEWLFEGGFRRPRVFSGQPSYYSKETHFFDIDWNFNRGLEYYAERFDEGNHGPALDATPDTLTFPERVWDTYQSAGGNQVNILKIIVILRNPVARELSLYNHMAFDCRTLDPSQLTDWYRHVMKRDGSIMSFEEFVRDVSMPALARKESEDGGSGRSSRHGLYETHLQKWFNLFDRNQILVLSYDELCMNPQKVQERIQNFVGMTIIGNICHRNCNSSLHKIRAPSKEARQRLELFLRPHNDRLYELLQANPGPPMEQRPFPRFT